MNCLDPKGINFSNQNKLPFFNPIKKYFNKIKAQETYVSILLENLVNDQEILKTINEVVSQRQAIDSSGKPISIEKDLFFKII